MSDGTMTLSDEQMMLLMAHADGELDGEELGDVQALLRDNPMAQQWIEGFSAGKSAVASQVMIEATDVDLATVTEQTAIQTEALQLMLHVDNELTAEQRQNAGIEALLQSSSAARNWVNDLQIAKQAMHDEVMQPNNVADLSMVRGRIMTKLPAEERAEVARPKVGLFPAISAWLAELGLGKTVMAAGALAAALLLAVSVGQFDKPQSGRTQGSIAKAPLDGKGATTTAAPEDGEPEVIIEEMESDGGTVIFEGGEKPGEAVIIWHIDPNEEGAG